MGDACFFSTCFAVFTQYHTQKPGGNRLKSINQQAAPVHDTLCRKWHRNSHPSVGNVPTTFPNLVPNPCPSSGEGHPQTVQFKTAGTLINITNNRVTVNCRLDPSSNCGEDGPCGYGEKNSWKTVRWPLALEQPPNGMHRVCKGHPYQKSFALKFSGVETDTWRSCFSFIKEVV